MAAALEQILAAAGGTGVFRKRTAIQISAARAGNSSFRLVPSFLDFAFLAPLCFLIARPNGFSSLLGDGDTGWHLRTGEWIQQNGHVPVRDLFSFSKPVGEWFAWEWLWDLGFARLHAMGGLAAVLYFSVLILCVSFAILYGICRKKSGNSVVSFVFTLTAVCASSVHWLARPHLVTFLFAAVFYRLLETGPARRRQLLFAMPLLTVLWTNLHGGFIAGLLFIAAYFAGEMLRWRFTSGEDRRIARGSALFYLRLLALCSAATLINPRFYRLHQHLLAYLTDGYQMSSIAEFQSVSFHHPLTIFFELLLLLGIAAACWNAARRNFTPVVLVACWAHLALLSGRNIPIYAIVAAPIVAGAVSAWLARTWAGRGSFFSEMDLMESIPRLHLVSGVVVWLAGSVLFSPRPPARFQPEFNASVFPVEAADRLGRDGFTTRIFSTDDWSGYLIYRFGAGRRIFIDGRSDYYGPQLGSQYTGILNLKSGWRVLLKKYGVETILLPPGSVLSAVLQESGDWNCIYDDGVARVFRSVRPGDNRSAN